MSAKERREKVARKRFTVREAADILAVSVRSVRNRATAGYFPNSDLCECKQCIMIPVRDIHTEFRRLITESYKVKYSDHYPPPET